MKIEHVRYVEGGWIEFTTDILDPSNDLIQVYAKITDKIVICDDEQVMAYLLNADKISDSEEFEVFIMQNYPALQVNCKRSTITLDVTVPREKFMDGLNAYVTDICKIYKHFFPKYELPSN